MVGVVITGFRLLLFLTLAFLLVSFISSNTSYTTISLFPLPFEAEMPVYMPGLLMLFGGLVAGGLLVSAAYIGDRFRLSCECRKLRKKIAAMENELASLRLERGLRSSADTVRTLLPSKAARYGG